MNANELKKQLGIRPESTPKGNIKRALSNPKGLTGLLLLLVLVLTALSAPLLTDHPPDRRSGKPHEAPNSSHYLGTTRMGKDVFSQLLYGARTSLTVGFVAGLLATIVGVVVGLASGYFGGRVDDLLTFFVNVVLVLPALPLIIVIASFIDRASPLVIGFVLAATGWGWTARVIRTQTLAIKQKDFVQAAQLMDESLWRILLVQIMPNMLSLIVGGLVLATIYAILAEAGLEFIGLGDPSSVTWGTMLFWGQKNAALQVGAWWEILPACFAIMITGAALVLVNFSVDEVTNPLLRKLKYENKVKAYLKRRGLPA